MIEKRNFIKNVLFAAIPASIGSRLMADTQNVENQSKILALLNAQISALKNMKVSASAFGFTPPMTAQKNLTVTGQGWTTARSVGIAYQDTTGIWRLKFNINGSVIGQPNNNVIQLSLAGIATPPSANQAISTANLNAQSVGACIGYADNNAKTLTVCFGSIVSINTGLCLSGDIELAGKPDWA